MKALNANYCVLRPKILKHYFSSSSVWKSYVKETSQFPYMFYKAKVKNYGKSDKPIEFIISCMVLTGCQENGAAIWRVEEMTFSLL